jgi:hypothetical protein
MADNVNEEFLKDIVKNPEDDVLNKPLIETPEIAVVEDDKGFEAKNRRERRLLEQNQRLREEAIAAQAKLEGISEARRFQEDTGDDYIKNVRAIYGDADPRSKEASDILEATLRRIEEVATQKALEKVSEREETATTAVRENEDLLEDELGKAEDETGLDLSEGSADRRAVLNRVDRLSPKDRDGNIIEYADIVSIAEDYATTKRPSNERAKDLASRGRVASGASQPSKLEEDATWKALKDAGIF